jgi:hypothetical protein
MLRRSAIIVWFLLAGLFGLASVGWANGPEAGSDVDRVLTAAQAEIQFAGFAATLAAGYGRHAAALPPSAAEDFLGYARTAHDPDVLYPIFRAAFAEAFETAQADAVVAWLMSPAGQRASAAEISALGPDAAAAFQAYLPTLLALPEARKALVREYLAVTGAEEHAATLVTVPLRVYSEALRQAIPEAERGEEADDAGRTAEMERDAVAHYLAMMPAATAFTFRSLSDDDLRAMLDFYRSPAGRALVRASWAGTGAALRAAAATLGENTATLLRDYAAPPAPSP